MSDMTTIRSIEQERARFAYNHVKVISDEKYKSYVKKIPMLIKTNGLGPTFAYVKEKSKNEPAYRSIYEQTTNWLLKDKNNPFGINVNSDLVESIISLDSQTYRFLTNEVLFLFKWIIRFADGLIEEGSKNDGTGKK